MSAAAAYKAPPVKRAPPVKEARLTPAGVAALRRILRALRWDDQGGYVGYDGDGKWGLGVGLGVATSDEVSALFEMAGMTPDAIESIGCCRDCAHAINGREQGYAGPCLTCKRPRMSNFVPAGKLVRR